MQNDTAVDMLTRACVVWMLDKHAWFDNKFFMEIL